MWQRQIHDNVAGTIEPEWQKHDNEGAVVKIYAFNVLEVAKVLDTFTNDTSSSGLFLKGQLSKFEVANQFQI